MNKNIELSKEKAIAKNPGCCRKCGNRIYVGDKIIIIKFKYHDEAEHEIC